MPEKAAFEVKEQSMRVMRTFGVPGCAGYETEQGHLVPHEGCFGERKMKLCLFV